MFLDVSQPEFNISVYKLEPGYCRCSSVCTPPYFTALELVQAFYLCPNISIPPLCQRKLRETDTLLSSPQHTFLSSQLPCEVDFSGIGQGLSNELHWLTEDLNQGHTLLYRMSNTALRVDTLHFPSTFSA